MPSSSSCNPFPYFPVFLSISHPFWCFFGNNIPNIFDKFWHDSQYCKTIFSLLLLYLSQDELIWRNGVSLSMALQSILIEEKGEPILFDLQAITIESIRATTIKSRLFFVQLHLRLLPETLFLLRTRCESPITIRVIIGSQLITYSRVMTWTWRRITLVVSNWFILWDFLQLMVTHETKCLHHF